MVLLAQALLASKKRPLLGSFAVCLLGLLTCCFNFSMLRSLQEKDRKIAKLKQEISKLYEFNQS
jgi:hypothetical protein